MTAYSFGDVILVPFPFTDQSHAKQRPAVVVSAARYNTERPGLGRLHETDRDSLKSAMHVILG